MFAFVYPFVAFVYALVCEKGGVRGGAPAPEGQNFYDVCSHLARVFICSLPFFVALSRSHCSFAMLGLVALTLLVTLGLAALSLLATLRVCSALVLSSLGLCRCLAFALMMVFLVFLWPSVSLGLWSLGFFSSDDWKSYGDCSSCCPT